MSYTSPHVVKVYAGNMSCTGLHVLRVCAGSMSYTGLHIVRVWWQHVTHRSVCSQGVQAACHTQVCM